MNSSSVETGAGIAPAPELASSPSRPCHILVLDDVEIDRKLCRSLLTRSEERWHVIEAASANEGLSACATGDVDCVLLDYVLPDAQGLELIERLRHAADDPFLPVIMLTGMGDESIAARAILRGAADYIPKTRLNHSALVRSIENAREKAGLERAIARERDKKETYQAQLQQKNAELQSLYQTVSHELKTPLTAAREFVAMMAEGICGPVTEQQAEFLQLTTECCDTLAFLLNNWLDTVRSETGKLSLSTKRQSLAKLVRSCAMTYRVLAEKKQLQLEARIAPDLPEILFDAARIEQTIANLLSNAIKFTESGGRITLACGAEARHLYVEVTDTGRGVPVDKQQQIFEAFGQADEKDASERQGMGLGLHVCKTIVDLHGGQLTLTSRPGHGSSFRFELPRDECEERA